MKKKSGTLVVLGAVALVATAVALTALAPDLARTEDTKATEERTEPLSDSELDAVVEFIVAKLTDPAGCSQSGFEAEEIHAATGVWVPETESGRIQQAVLAALEETPEGQACLTTMNRCSDYGACSVDGNLASAKGELLKLYQSEKAQDGVALEGVTLPEFTAVDLEGKKVRSADLAGKPTVVAFLARHCGHSLQSLPVLDELARAYEPEGVRVVGVLVNTADADQARQWFGKHEPGYEVWVVPGTEIGDRVASHLVPSYFLVAADGTVHKKLVGFKEKSAVAGEIASLFGVEAEVAEKS